MLINIVFRFNQPVSSLQTAPNCKCGASKQTSDHVLTMCPILRAPHGARGLTVLHDKNRC